MADKDRQWTARFDEGGAPKYLQIVRSLAEDIQSGALSAGDRLPTHRDLAWRLGVTVGTVSRAYAEAERRGLIVGEVGRGSFVRTGARTGSTLGMPSLAGPGLIEMGMNVPPTSLTADVHRECLRELACDPCLDEFLSYQDPRGRWEHRQAGVTHVAGRGLKADASRVLVTCGAEHGISAALASLSEPGDVLFTDALTWPGTRALAGLFGLDVHGVAGDELGMLPDALERAGRATGGRLLYLMPALQNPLATTMPEVRRRAIADVAKRCGMTIVEDDIYSDLLPDAPPPIATLLPERTIFVTSLSKTVSPALRTGFSVASERFLPRLANAARALNWMAPPMDVEMAVRLIHSGGAAEVTQRIVAEMRARHALMHEAFDGLSYRDQATGLHVWLRLPEPWRAEQLVSMARRAGLSITPTDLFATTQAPPAQGVRVCLGAATRHDVLRDGLSRLARLVAGGPIGELNVA